jgi:hypothetical protein
VSVPQYLRKLSMVIGSASGDGLDFSQFRVQFSIRRGDFQMPNTADVRIYNLAANTANRIQKEFTDIAIQAGYGGNFGLIFRGTIKQVRLGRQDQKDSYVDITAADGDEAYNYSHMALSLAAGPASTSNNAIQAFLQTMAQGAITEGYVPDLSQNGALRGRVYYGLTRDELRDFAEQNDCLWSIQNGALTLIPQTSYIPGEIPVISPATGLVGVPEQTQNGIHIRVLLNPYLKIGQVVKLDSTINPYRYGLDIQSQASNALISTSIKTNADGLYYVMIADYSGDTRGNEWYTDLTCLAVDATVPPNLAPQAAIFPAAASIRRD